jgi:hypothetical protein
MAGTRARWMLAGATLWTSAALACGDVNAAYEKLAQARQVSSHLHVEFTKAADAANRAVMADTDAASVAAAQEAAQAKDAVRKDVNMLGPMLQSLHYDDESRVLQDFAARFAEYEAVDGHILELAVENSNLKAQRLSFGPARDAADAMRDALETVVSGAPAGDTWRIRAVAETAIAAVRDIQALQAPHIAEPDDAAMARLETRMTASEAAARGALQTLATDVPATSRPKVAAATTALNQFMEIHAQILVLSHRNTNVHSLVLSLSQKPALTAACDERLRTLQDALTKRGPKIGRW